MIFFLSGIAIMAISGLPGLLMSSRDRRGQATAEILALLGTITTLIGLLSSTTLAGETVLRAGWSIPGGELLIRIDAISLIFLFPFLLVFAMSVLFGKDYWPQAQHPENSRKLRLFHGLIAAGMTLVFTAQNGILFLFAWEVMALASFFLITTEDDRQEARRAGFIYLVATHTGTLALFALFALLDLSCGSFSLPAAGTLPASAVTTAIFLLALFGFGLKAGIMPLHIWLPGAHAAAPSHISALLSGIMIKTGIYGLVRITSLFATIPLWWGWVLIILGVITGIFGVAYALAQHDLKRLLAYHSVENIGIITLGLGLALLGRSAGLPELAMLGLAGALLHVVNHALFKSLLFLSAGAVIHTTGTREIDQMGGLIRSHPWTAALFLGGAVAICGLPPFNGFISEWFIYQGSFRALVDQRLTLSLAILVAPVLALIGGLALACFVKVFGIVFLGAPRTPAAAAGHDATWLMRTAMLVLLAACLSIGLLPWLFAPLLEAATLAWAPLSGSGAITASMTSLVWIGILGTTLILFSGLLSWWLHRRSQQADTEQSTWGCGYLWPTNRMQYTASSFAAPLVKLFRFGLWSQEHGGKTYGLFPSRSSFTSHTPDSILDRLLLPLLHVLAIAATWLRTWLQNGVTSLYLLYVVLTLFALLLLSGR
ncbi:MAG: hydrogenase [Desulfuromonadales bacterium]|nr:hydrogenase [Desulfuromonadales bacterium]